MYSTGSYDKIIIVGRKENGEYLLLSKFDEEVVFEYHITIRDEDFNLGILTMRTPEGVFEADFDE